MTNFQNPLSAGDVYDAIGSAGFQKLIGSFYTRVAHDDILRPMYPGDDLAPAARRLRLFLEQYFGGPPIYSQERGHPRLRMRHMPFKINQVARDRWVKLMIAALDDCEFAPEVNAILRNYFEQGASFLMNQFPTASGMFSTPRSSDQE